MKRLQLDRCEYLEKARLRVKASEGLDGFGLASGEALDWLVRRSASENCCNHRRKLFSPVLQEIADRLAVVGAADKALVLGRLLLGFTADNRDFFEVPASDQNHQKECAHLRSLFGLLEAFEQKSAKATIRSVALSAAKCAEQLLEACQPEAVQSHLRRRREEVDVLAYMAQRDEFLRAVLALRHLLVALKGLIRAVTHYGVIASSLGLAALAEKSRGASIIFRRHPCDLENLAFATRAVFARIYYKFFQRWLVQFSLIDEK